MSRYVLTPQAKSDLEEISDFISQDSPRSARRVLSELRKAMRRLAESRVWGMSGTTWRRSLCGSGVFTPI